MNNLKGGAPSTVATPLKNLTEQVFQLNDQFRQLSIQKKQQTQQQQYSQVGPRPLSLKYHL
jgi:hypothetical protein